MTEPNPDILGSARVEFLTTGPELLRDGWSPCEYVVAIYLMRFRGSRLIVSSL